MRFSRKTDYGFILLEALAPTFASGNFMALGAIAEEEHLPFPFLEKIVAILKKSKMVEARKGAAGGYRLARDPKTVTFAEVIRIFGEPPMMQCMRSPHPEKFCPLVPHCPTRSRWLAIEKEVNEIFQRVTIDSFF